MELLRCRSLIVFVLLAEIGWLQHWSVRAAPQRDIKFRIECRPEDDISLAALPPSLLSKKPDSILKQDDSGGQDQDSEQSAPHPQIKAVPNSKLASDDNVAESPENIDNRKLPKIPKLKLPLKDAIMERIKSTELQSLKRPDLLRSKNTQADLTGNSGNNKVASPNEAVDYEDETVPNDNKVTKFPKLSSILKPKQIEASSNDTPKPKESLLSKIAKLKEAKEPEIIEQPESITESSPVKLSRINLKSKLLKSPKIGNSQKEQLGEGSDPAPKYTKPDLLRLKNTQADPTGNSGDNKIASPNEAVDGEGEATKPKLPKLSSILKSKQSKSSNDDTQKPKESLLSKIAKLNKSKEPEIIEQPDSITESSPVQSPESKLSRIKLKSKLLKSPKIGNSPKEQLAETSAPAPKYTKPDLLRLKNTQADPTGNSSDNQIASPNEAVDGEGEATKPKLPKLSSILKSKQSKASSDDTPKPKESLLSKIAKLTKSKEPEIVEQPDLKSKLLKSPKIGNSAKEQLAEASAPAPKYTKPDLLRLKNTQADPTGNSGNNKVTSLNEAEDGEGESTKPKLPKLSSILKSKQSKASSDDTPKPMESLLSKIAKLKKSKEPEIVEQPDSITESSPARSPESKPSRIKLKSKLLKSPKASDSLKEQLAEESAPAPKYSKLDKLLKKSAAPEKFESSGDDYVISPKSTALKKAPPLKSSLLKSSNFADSEPESPIKPLNLDKLSSALARLKSTASSILEDDGSAEKLAPPKLSRLSKAFDFESLRPKKLNVDNNFLESERYSPKVPKLRARLPDPPVRKPLLRKPYNDRYLAAEQTDFSPMAMSLCECIKKAFPKGVKDGSFVLSDDGDLAPSADSMHPVYAAAPAMMQREARLADEESSAEKYSRIKNGVQKMIHFVDILGQVDQYISDRTKIIVNKLSKLYDNS